MTLLFVVLSGGMPTRSDNTRQLSPACFCVTFNNTRIQAQASATPPLTLQVTVRDLDPKSISTQELYGYVNMSTREWKDGLLSYNMRELANQPDDNPKWILLDGDLDANW